MSSAGKSEECDKKCYMWEKVRDVWEVWKKQDMWKSQGSVQNVKSVR